ncbi:hypothetical protein AQ490_09505 [Wenjunlia vitaminophila]|uniref:Uncharacterized protein n=2 Tax=Wenjunlia vitaminophila TaxID=76728 RepID=A0A0T6LLK2_WENVI|nr:hypothetical protein [Wenjunlia vitaminophila]KRV46987.1 hypothetical protein AQ490_09505 [Wenjunlia vitaminophila]
MNASMANLVPLAEQLDKNKVTPGVLGFLVVAAMGVALWFLLKNMNKQFGKVNFTEEPEPGEERGTERTPGTQSGSAKPA